MPSPQSPSNSNANLRQTFNLPLFDSILIASDVDRTLLSPPARFLEEEVEFLTLLHQKGVQFLFATGRSETAARDILSPLPFPYYLAPQNGTTLLYNGKRVKLHHIYLEELKDDLYQNWVLMGDGVSFYDPRGFTPEEEDYLISRAILLNETLVLSPPTTPIFSLKRFGEREKLQKDAAHFIEQGFTVTFTKDVLRAEVTVAQITPKGVNKGSALDDLLLLIHPKPTFIIGCGDDYNDLPLLLRAHYKIVMADAPKEILQVANYMAESADTGGLFKALKTLFNLI